MKITLKRKNIYLIVIFYSIAAILSAIYIENILGYLPCKLCLYQRIPFIFSIFLCFLGYYYFKSDKILIYLILLFSISFIIAGYHFGIENGFFEEFGGCSANNLEIISKKELLESLTINISCKDAIFKIFGVSLSGWNTFISLLIVIISLRILFYEKNK